MATRVVEGKNPYTGGEAISIDENKVISLNLRDENNLIIYDSGDDEIYVDLQLPDGIRPTDAFPVGVTTGRVLVADDWDLTGTIICAKTTSGDNIKILYADDGTLWMDNGTGLFKQVYFKSDVDALLLALRTYIDEQLALKQDLLTAGDGISIDQNDEISVNALDLIGTGLTVDEDDNIAVDTTVIATQTDLSSKQDTLTAGTNITISSNTISATDTTYTAGTGLSLNGTEFSNSGVTSVNGSTGAITNVMKGANSTTAGYTFSVVSALPDSPDSSVIYIVTGS